MGDGSGLADRAAAPDIPATSADVGELSRPVADHDGLWLDAEPGHLVDLVSAKTGDLHDPLRAEEARNGGHPGEQVVPDLVEIQDQLAYRKVIQLVEQSDDQTSPQLSVVQFEHQPVERIRVHAASCADGANAPSDFTRRRDRECDPLIPAGIPRMGSTSGRAKREGAPKEMRMISGVITTRHVLKHAPTIVREFGLAAYLRCCLMILRRRNTTFLDCVLRPRTA